VKKTKKSRDGRKSLKSGYSNQMKEANSPQNPQPHHTGEGNRPSIKPPDQNLNEAREKTAMAKIAGKRRYLIDG